MCAGTSSAVLASTAGVDVHGVIAPVSKPGLPVSCAAVRPLPAPPPPLVAALVNAAVPSGVPRPVGPS